MIHVIIGVGAAGITAAKTIRENDPDAAITMISTDEHVHSRCMLHRYLSHERNEDTLSFVEPDFFRDLSDSMEKRCLCPHHRHRRTGRCSQ